MIDYEAFKTQMKNDVLPALCKWNNCSYCVFDSQVTNAMYLRVKHPVSSVIQFEIKISFHKVYKEPTLQFRLWKLSISKDNFEEMCLWFPNQSKLPLYFTDNDFQITLEQDIMNRQIWYTIHPCDNEKKVGKDPNHYVKRWASISLRLFDDRFSDIFL